MDRESAGCIPFHSSTLLPPRLPQGLHHPRWTPNRGWVLLGVGTPPLPASPSHSSGVPDLEVLPLLLLPLPSLPLPQDPRGWRGPRWAEDQAQDFSRLLGAQVGRGNLATLPFDPLLSQRSPSFPLRAWDPFPSPSCPSGAPVPSHLHFSSPLTPPHAPHPTQPLGVPPAPLGVHGPPAVPGRCPSCAEM